MLPFDGLESGAGCEMVKARRVKRTRDVYLDTVPGKNLHMCQQRKRERDGTDGERKDAGGEEEEQERLDVHGCGGEGDDEKNLCIMIM